MTVQFTLTASAYRCDPCTRRQGTIVSELVRMIKAPGILNGQLVGDEHWGCPICLEPKFPVRKPRAPKPKAK